jgi:hypothetical protein
MKQWVLKGNNNAKFSIGTNSANFGNNEKEKGKIMLMVQMEREN